MPTLLLFAIGLLSRTTVQFIGDLKVSELLCIGCLPFFTSQIWTVLRLREYRIFLLFASVYLLGLIISDVYRETPTVDYIRGWAKVAMLILATIACGGMVVGKEVRITSFLLGAGLAPLGNLITNGFTRDSYKFYIGTIVASLVFISIGLFRERVRGRFVLPFAAGLVALLFNARAVAACTILAGCYIGISHAKVHLRLSARAVGRTIILALLAGASILFLYGYGAPRGWFGEESRSKYTMQAGPPNERRSILLSGRSEILFALPKIVSSPLIGHGSWAKDLAYVERRSAELGMKRVSRHSADSGLIPTHSHLFGGWLEAGLPGALFWVYAIAVIAITLIKRTPMVLTTGGPLLVYALIILLWDILFSPFGGERRFTIGFLLSACLTLQTWCRIQLSTVSRATLRHTSTQST